MTRGWSAAWTTFAESKRAPKGAKAVAALLREPVTLGYIAVLRMKVPQSVFDLIAPSALSAVAADPTAPVTMMRMAIV
jgi:hypothetical protein